MTNGDPEPQRGLLPKGFRDSEPLGPDWAGIATAIWLAAVFMVFGALFLNVSIGTAGALGLLWLAAPLIALYAVVLAIVGLRLTLEMGSDRREAPLKGVLTRLGAACRVAGVPLWIGTLASFAVWHFEWGTQAEARVLVILAAAFAAVAAVVAWWMSARAERAS